MLDDAQLSTIDSENYTSDLPVNNFPPTRYYGSKRKQFSWLCEIFRGIKGGSALDAFGGTGTMSYLLHSLGWKTTFNDILLFNTISARAIFSDSTSRLSEGSLLSFMNSVTPHRGFISETFHNCFFLEHENQWIDGCMRGLELLPNSPERDLIMHCLFQAALKKRPFNLFHRANLNIRTSSVKVKFGNRTTWDRSFSSHILQTYKEVEEFQSKHNFSIKITQGMPAERLDPIYDLVYLDPPYIKKRKHTESYLDRYHFLEGLARLDEWSTLMDCNSKTKRINKGYDAEWSTKKQLLSSLESMIHKHKDSIFALSYCTGGTPTEDELMRTFHKFFRHVRVQKKDFGRALSRRSATEIIIVGDPHGIL